MNRSILRIALPAILTNITVPLLGLVDSAITGHLGSTALIGAITVGAMAFNLMYWLFAFLRMGTSGLTSQALGRGDSAEVRALLRRALRVAVALALALVVLQWPIRQLIFWLMGAEGEVRTCAYTYFNICIWGAPASLGLFALTGWFIGMQDSKVPMWVAIVQNVTNILASLLLVFVFGLSLRGVALGTVIAQWTGFLFALRKAWTHPVMSAASVPSGPPSPARDSCRDFFRINRDIFLRTLCLVGVNLAFTSYGARQGEVVLGVNGMLMQLFLLFSFFIDGFAFAGEAISGKAIGAGERHTYDRLVRHMFAWGLGLALLFSAAYALFTPQFIALLTDQASIRAASVTYAPYIALVPLFGMPAFIWDGIYVGATASRQMLLTVLAATLVFFVILAFCTHSNHALWVAFLCYLATRGAMQTGLRKTVWPSTPENLTLNPEKL